jgi:hypothetical protein
MRVYFAKGCLRDQTALSYLLKVERGGNSEESRPGVGFFGGEETQRNLNTLVRKACRHFKGLNDAALAEEYRQLCTELVETINETVDRKS